jgi:hypothetical protein
MLIAQLSDVHVGGCRYREELLRAAIEEINAAAPDLVVVAGDLTDEGYPDQYPLAQEELSALACPLIVRMPGNHDARNVGYLHFEDTFGARDSRLRLELDRLKIALVAVDSSKPDLDEGEIGREHYGWIEEGFAGGNRPRAKPRCLTRATYSRSCASARSTSSSPATATSRTSGRSRACCSSTPAPSPRCARAASPTPPTTSSASRRGGSPSTSASLAASSRAWVTTRDWPPELSARHADPFVRAQRGVSLAEDETTTPRA